MVKRVVITGIGVLTSIGIGKDAFWKGLEEGKEGINEITSFDVSSYRTKTGGEIRNFDFQRYFPDKNEYLDKVSQLILVAAKQSVEDSKLEIENPYRAGVIIGTLGGGLRSGEKSYKILLQEGLENVPVFISSETPLYVLSDHLSVEFNLKGPKSTIVTACAAGTNAIGYAFDFIRYNRADIMLAGGADIITETVHGGFNIVYALTLDKCRPFDRNRSGFFIGEGAGVLVLESLEYAIKRKVHIYAEVAGYGLSSDAYHMSAPDPQGEGAVRSMEYALEDAGISIDEISYINAHGTGTPQNDKMETIAIKKVGGKYADKIPISSIKAMTGHTMGASGIIEAIACLMAIEKGIIPPTINYETFDFECDLNYITNHACQQNVDVSLSNSFGFGGNNASIIFKRYKP